MFKLIKSVSRGGCRAFSCQHVLRKSTESQIQVGKFNINYVRTGSEAKTGPAVLLLPGALGSAQSDFKPQLAALPGLLPNHTIIAWDPPGYGKSRPPAKRFHLDFYEEDAEVANDLMNKLDLPSYSILGWSDGGITGMIMSGLYPKAVSKLVIWGSNAFVLEKETKIYDSIRDVSKWSEKMRQPMEAMYGKEGFAELWSQWIDALIAIYKERNGDICKEHVKKIVSPTLIVHGAKDPMIAEEHVPYLQKNIKNNELFVFPDGKHNVHLRYAEEFNSLVAKFLMK